MKKLILFLLMYSNMMVGQQTTFNIRDRYNFLACVLTSVHPTDSCYYATGVIADTLAPFRTGAIFIKFDLNGQPLFIKTVKSQTKSYEPWFNDLLPLDNGNFMVDAVTIDSVEKTMLMQFNKEGDTVFTKEYLHPAYPAATFIQPNGGFSIMPDGGFVIADRIEKIGGSDDDILLTRTDSMGNTIWKKTYSTLMNDIPASILKTGEGKIIIASLRTNLNTNAENYILRTHVFQVDSLGNKEWEYTSPISAGLRDLPNNMILLEDGSLIVASGVAYEEIQSSVNGLLFEKYVFKLNPQHQIEWELTFPDSAITSWSRTSKLVNLSDGSGYILAGAEFYPKMYPIYKQPVKGWIAKISPDGDSVWTRRYAFLDNTVMANIIYDMKETPDGGLIFCGESIDNEDGAFYPQRAWLLKLDKYGCLVPGCQLNDAVEENKTPDKISLSIYPNPISDYLNFYVTAPIPASGVTIRIINGEGKLVKEFKTDSFNSTFILPVWDWVSGVYWVQVVVEGEVMVTNQFIKLK